MSDKFDIALSFATEDQTLVERVYRYLRAEGLHVFFAPAPECQKVLSGRNQREIFYEIFGLKAKYVALFVSKYYVEKEIPMEEAGIAFAKHESNGSVVPIYLDGTDLPLDMFDPGAGNYFKSSNAAVIAEHLSSKMKAAMRKKVQNEKSESVRSTMNISDNIAEKQIFINTFEGDISL